ncbi:MAG: 30S ribosome-binding factor RbfA [Candidatus Electrothrix sp. YB6]
MEFDFTLPGLGRPKSSRPERVAEAVRQELSVLLQQKVRDPGLAGVSISRVQISPNLKRAKIYFLVPAGSSPAGAKKNMERAAGFFRSHIARTINLRYTPELVFFFDNQQQEAERLDQLFAQINREQKGKDHSE